MEIINKSLQVLDTNLASAIQKLKNEAQQAIVNTADYYFNSYKNYDITLVNYFPKLSNMPEIKPENIRFNPKMVIEYDILNQEPKKILREGDWNKDIGYLPNRKVMYEIELIQCRHINEAKIFENLDIYNLKNFMNDGNFWTKDLFHIPQDINIYNINELPKKCRKVRIGTNTFNVNDINFKEPIWKFILEVDNYLNITSKLCMDGYITENIYFCFNKTPFPDFSFLSNNKFKNFIMSGEHNILNEIHKDIIFSNDKNQYILTKSRYFVPENYKEVYNYFNGIRKLGNLYNELDKEDKNKIIYLEEQLNLDKEKIKNLEKQLKDKSDLLEKYKSLVN